MTTALPPSPQQRTPAAHPHAAHPHVLDHDPAKLDLKVTSYDKVASLLISLIVMVGAFVGMLFAVWLTTVLVFAKASPPVELIEEPAGRGDHAKGYARDLEEPGLEELEELETPQLEATLEAVTDAVTSMAASLDSLHTDATVSGKGSGLGDSRKSGPGGEGEDIIPRWERWQIRYASDSISKYAEQLDFFGIELGAAGGGVNQVDYARNFSRSPVKRSGSSEAEKRLYMTWTSGELVEMDRQLLTRAGVPVQRRVTMQFIPKDTENRLALLELQHAEPQGKTVKNIRKTIFGVQGSSGRYEFFVMSQYYRN
ncbi:MAG: hypothetical protein J5I93_10185 [Pirellulaceae bacterium]|nr:hypothetical protein [Pirellulaceae bacterium]